MKKKPPAVFYWITVSAYAVLIFLLSSMSHPLPRQFRNFFYDWVLHGVEYGILGFFLAGALRFSLRIRALGRLTVSAVFLCTGFGVSDEWHQSFVPGRQASLEDLAGDILGALIGSLVLFWIVGGFKKKANSYASD